MSRSYDPRFRPWWEKTGITLGMGMTEKQGGTDVRANTTRAAAGWRRLPITGHKWFMSAPMCDAFLVLAQAPGGLTCFLMPRFRPDGSVNALRFQRLKDKLGNRSNASSEVEFAEAFAWRVGEEGRGVRTIIQMVQLTRLDCAIASAGHHAHGAGAGDASRAPSHRVPEAPRRPADDAGGARRPGARGRRGDRARHAALPRRSISPATDPREAARARLLTPAVKYLVCKTAPGFVYEAMECLGGNGYVEESVLPRLYREAPVNAIWEGSGNVMCLDVLRALAHEGDAARAVLDALASDAADLPGAREAARSVETLLSSPDAEATARAAVGRLALLAATAALAPRRAARSRRAVRAHAAGGAHDAMFGTSAIAPTMPAVCSRGRCRPREQARPPACSLGLDGGTNRDEPGLLVMACD